MKVASLLSGGKDSLYALYVVLQHGWDVKYLVSLIPKRQDSWMFHSANIHLVNTIADVIGIPLVTKTTAGRKEEELNDLKIALEGLDIDGVVSGAIASDYQRERICKVCDELNLRCFVPIWHKNQEMLLRYQIAAGFEIMVDHVSAEGLGKEWLGKIIDEKNVDEFIEICRRYGINPSGEGGEFETIVLDSPLYREKLFVEDMRIRWYRDYGYCEIIKLRRERKSVSDIPKFLHIGEKEK